MATKKMKNKPTLVFPELLRVHLLEEEPRTPIQKIAIKITFFAPLKNNYSITPCLSDSEGNINISKEWVIKSLQEIRNMFVMDYSSSLEECAPFVTIESLSENEVLKLISGMKNYNLRNGGGGIGVSIAELEISVNKSFQKKNIQILLDQTDSFEKNVEILLNRI